MRSPINRREFLLRSGGGFGGLAMSQVLGSERSIPHHAPKAKRVIQLFMNGGVSQMDTFDPKPKLKELNGQAFDPGTGALVESVTNSPGFKVLASPFEFKQHGQSGRWVSNVFPHMAKIVDELTFLTSMTSKTNVHGLGSYMQNTGFTLPGFPCMGAWISYGLGNINKDLPEFVVMPDPKGLPYNNLGNFTAGFLPAKHQGTVINVKSNSPINYLFPPQEAKQITAQSESDGLELLRSLNQKYAQKFPSDSQLEARIKSYELAARMQLSAPHIFDLSGETQATKKLYGLEEDKTADFARRCIIGRRMLESGVRFVQIWSGAGGPTNNWDNHANISTELPKMTRQVDQPIAALVRDLKSRGMLEDTLVIWTTEFGRMPFSQGQAGRDHNGGTFVTWLAGAGIKPGVAHGQSDEWAWKAKKEIWCYDLHATILHLLGIDHEKLSVRHNGINRRLTDVHGHVINEILI
ncbi:DUF1501 domain-containing protein [Verrucomicrobiales bacterium]|nr:DUF1501 domain-containing protein [Verrucomicrobiales bacterium]MDB4721784.1 DUF1501 domain-containing protein [Verrucomicrobiales bacterium]